MSTSPWLAIDESAPVPGRVERESLHDGVRIQSIRYFSHTLGDFSLEMAAFLALPPGPGPHPALLHLHGGAQSAKAEIALAWAQKGYVTLCPDWSGPANTPQAAHATRWPENTPPTHAVNLDAAEATIGHIVRAVRHGISLLAALPEVRQDRIGMVGISWGGFMTWLVNGTDSRLRTAIAVYGSGRSDSVTMSPSWRAHFQPESVAATQNAPILHLNGTHDFFGHLSTSEALLKKVGPGARRLYVPNEDHGLNDAARESAWAWLNRHLTGDGTLPPEPDIRPATGKRFFHARSMDRTAVWREVPADGLPETGCLFSTESHPDGLTLSSPVRVLPPEPLPPTPTLWDHTLHGTDGLFLRWEQDNLAIHAPAKARLVSGEQGVTFSPPVPSFQVFLRCEPTPATSHEPLHLTLTAPAGTRIRLRAYAGPEINEDTAQDYPEQVCDRNGPQTVRFTPNQEAPPNARGVLSLQLLTDPIPEDAIIALQSLRAGSNPRNPTS